MERIVQIHIERLPEGVYLATSDEIQGLVAQGRTISETLEIARDIIQKLIQSRQATLPQDDQSASADSFDYPLVIAV